MTSRILGLAIRDTHYTSVVEFITSAFFKIFYYVHFFLIFNFFNVFKNSSIYKITTAIGGFMNRIFFFTQFTNKSIL